MEDFVKLPIAPSLNQKNYALILAKMVYYFHINFQYHSVLHAKFSLLKCSYTFDVFYSPIDKTEDTTCEDNEAWCIFMSEFECEEDQVQENCHKACHQCSGKQSLTKYII